MALTQQQFEKSVIEYGPVLRRALLRLTHGRAGDADDLLQRTFERAWQKRETFRGGEVGPWLRGIARYEHLNHLRRRGQQLKIKNAYMQECEDTVHQVMPSLPEERSPLKTCIGRLSPADQLIINLFYGRNPQLSDGESTNHPLTDKEVAVKLSTDTGENWSPDRVRTRRHRALKSLRKCLKPKLKGD